VHIIFETSQYLSDSNLQVSDVMMWNRSHSKLAEHLITKSYIKIKYTKNRYIVKCCGLWQSNSTLWLVDTNKLQK